MAAEEKIIYVYDDFSCDKPMLLGRLFVGDAKVGETCSFEYDADWLDKSNIPISLDPDLQPYTWRQFPLGKDIFGLFADATPNRWGRKLMDARERVLANGERRQVRKLYDSDFLLGVYDEPRMGGLHFKLDPNGDYYAIDTETAIPFWTALRSLEEVVRRYETNAESLSGKEINQLIRAGACLGGARPKVTVVDKNGQLWIAKFPSKNDANDNGAWEKVAHDLAGLCGLNIPESKIEKLSKKGSTFLIKRFDRDGKRRIHYASAMTLLGKRDGASAGDGTSYLDIAEFIKTYGAEPGSDLVELWKRIVFNMAITNTDDHLRNHAFLYSPIGWKLSPLYDVNPVPYGDELALLVDDTDNHISIDLAIQTAPLYGITQEAARQIAMEMTAVIRDNWERLARAYGLSHAQTEAMRPAFRECYKTKE